MKSSWYLFWVRNIEAIGLCGFERLKENHRRDGGITEAESGKFSARKSPAIHEFWPNPEKISYSKNGIDKSFE